MKHIFLEVQQRIETEVPEIKWIDEDSGQLEGYYERPPVLFPCALIDFDDVDFEDLGTGMQMANGIIKIKVGFNPLHQTNNKTPMPVKTKALERFDLLAKLNAALHGWGGEKFTTLSRIKQVSIKGSPLKIYEVSYKLAWEETIE